MSVVVAVQAAAACDSVVTARACCHSLPFSVPDHRHAASLLFCSGNAAGIVFGMLLPIPLLWCVKKEINRYDGTPLLLLQAAASSSSQCDFYRQPGGQQLLQY